MFCGYCVQWKAPELPRHGRWREVGIRANRLHQLNFLLWQLGVLFWMADFTCISRLEEEYIGTLDRGHS